MQAARLHMPSATHIRGMLQAQQAAEEPSPAVMSLAAGAVSAFCEACDSVHPERPCSTAPAEADSPSECTSPDEQAASELEVSQYAVQPHHADFIPEGEPPRYATFTQQYAQTVHSCPSFDQQHARGMRARLAAAPASVVSHMLAIVARQVSNVMLACLPRLIVLRAGENTVCAHMRRKLAEAGDTVTPERAHQLHADGVLSIATTF